MIHIQSISSKIKLEFGSIVVESLTRKVRLEWRYVLLDLRIEIGLIKADSL
jgi:hypothetical protein